MSATGSSASTNAAGAQILIVDDDQDLLRLLALRLNAWGFRVTTATSAEQGLARVKVYAPTAQTRLL